MLSAITDSPHLIVGAGPAGLATARAFRMHGLRTELVEAHKDVGGIWDQDNPGSPMYDSAHFISSRRQSGFAGFPMPDSFPDYPGHQLLLGYLREFADRYRLYETTRLGVRVLHATPEEDGWLVRCSDDTTRRYATLTAASGTTWHPNMPTWPGVFKGTLLHSSQYRRLDQLTNRRVLVVGAGNSGVDIACDAARVAEVAALSLRRGYHLVPKHIFGLPADEFGTRGPRLPILMQQSAFRVLLRILEGDPARYGWPTPDHRLFESHPIVNDQIVHHLRHGDVTTRRDVRAFDGHDVVFADGTREAFDVVIAATGYRYDLPYLDPTLLRWRAGRPELRLHTFSAELPRFAAVGLFEYDGGIWPVFDELGDLIARTFKALEDGDAAFHTIRRAVTTARPDLEDRIRHIASDRHAAYAHRTSLARQLKRLRREAGWPVLPTFDAPTPAGATR